MKTTAMSLCQHQLERIQRKRDALRAISRRYDWLRLGAFLGFVFLTWFTAAAAGSRPAAAVGLATLAFFAAIVILQRRLDRQEMRLQIWQHITREQYARQALDWEHIPSPPFLMETPRHPLSLDLDITGPRSLHHLLDTAISHQGSQKLAGWLLANQPDVAQIAGRQAVVAELAKLPGFRKHLTSIFRQISRRPLDAEKLLVWLRIAPPGQKIGRMLPFAAALAATNVGLFLLSTLAGWPPYWVLSGALYGLLYVANMGAIGEFVEAVVKLDDELMPFQAVLRYLERYPYHKNRSLAGQCAVFLNGSDRPSRRLRQLKWVTAAAGMRMNPIVGLLLNLVSPWDFWAAWLAARQRARMAALLPAWLEAFHELEALISLGNFAAINPGYTFPKVAAQETGHPDGAAFWVRGMGHPLLPPREKVCNDFELENLGELALITGSNMAGKSTFIRTVGVNLCLAQAGGPVDASAWRSLPFRLYTCIRISDSLSDGFSYFYAEVKRLRGLLEELQQAGETPRAKTPPLFYLIDEIFRGTNNRERLIGSRAYVRALAGANGMGLIATHDLELAGLAEENTQIANFHFRDEVKDGKLAFDYRIRPGASPTTNALKIMQMEGLPVAGL
ncbi:MAG: MutS-related protein [Chloroflexota bacterium]